MALSSKSIYETTSLEEIRQKRLGRGNSLEPGKENPRHACDSQSTTIHFQSITSNHDGYLLRRDEVTKNELNESISAGACLRYSDPAVTRKGPNQSCSVEHWTDDIVFKNSPGGKVGLVEFRSFEETLHPCSNIVLSANKYIRKMKGGSQSILVHANDGRHYVVKMADNPIGPNLLANEHMGSLVAEAVGLPVAEARGICLSDSFIDSHPDLWFELPFGVRRPEKGVHFGSLLLGQTSGADRPTEYISPSRIDRITNRKAFLGMYLLDVWANHQDNRQAIFRRSTNNSQEVCFIDHGHMFGGPGWNFQDNLGSALHLEMAVYKDLWQDEQIGLWISRFQSVIPEALVLATQSISIQPQWYQGDLTKLTDRLTERLTNLAELVQQDFSRNWRAFEQKNIDETLRLSDSGIHGLGASDTRRAFYRRRATA
jgi:hypothetical protein